MKILTIALLVCTLAANAAQQPINIGHSANDGTGDTLPVAGSKINANFSELYNIVTNGFFDPDAALFSNLQGGLVGSDLDRLDSFIKVMKRDGLWNSVNDAYPLLPNYQRTTNLYSLRRVCGTNYGAVMTPAGLYFNNTYARWLVSVPRTNTVYLVITCDPTNQNYSVPFCMAPLGGSLYQTNEESLWIGDSVGGWKPRFGGSWGATATDRDGWLPNRMDVRKHSICWTIDSAGNTSTYLDGCAYNSTSATSSPVTWDLKQMILGAHASANYVTDVQFQGSLCLAVVMNRPLSAAEIKTLDMDARWLQPSKENYLYIGDSLTKYNFVSAGWHEFSYPQQIEKVPGGTKHEYWQEGWSSRLATFPDPLFDDVWACRAPTNGVEKATAFYWMGMNNLLQGASGSATFAIVSSNWVALKNKGFDVVALTMHQPSNGYSGWSATKEVERIAFNNLVVSNYLSFGVRLVRPDVLIPPFVDSSATNYTLDGLHFTKLGYSILAKAATKLDDSSYTGSFRGNGAQVTNIPPSSLQGIYATKVIGTHPGLYFTRPYNYYSAATARTKHYIVPDAVSIGIGLSGITASGGPNDGENLLTNSVEVCASYEYTNFANVARYIPFYFSGKRLAVVSSNMLYSDLSPFPPMPTQPIWTRVFYHRLSSTNYTRANGERGTQASAVTYVPDSFGEPLRGASLGTGEGVYYRSATDISPFDADLTDGGSIPASDNRSYSPSVIFGQCLASSSYSVAIIGDSIAAGSTDYPDKGPGYIARALGDSIPYVFPSISGEYASTWASNSAPLRMSLAKKADIAIIELGSNDIYNNINPTNAIVKVASELVANGMVVYITTILPRSTSTDHWTTTANQTTSSLNNFNQVRTNVNAWIRTVPFPFAGYFEVADLVETSRDSGIWKAPGTPIDTGTASGGSAITLVDSTKTWTANQWTGYMAHNITQNKWAQIAYNTSNTLSTPNSWACSAGDSYEILAVYTIDGTHPTMFGHVAASAGINTNVMKANYRINLTPSTAWK